MRKGIKLKPNYILLIHLKMKTRSKTMREQQEMIDFDEASTMWKSNKVTIGNGSYKYVCSHKSKNNIVCKCKCLPFVDFCKKHLT